MIDISSLLFFSLLSGKASPPEEIINKAQKGRGKADYAVHEGIAEGIGRHPQKGCRQAYGNIERPEIGGSGNPCPGRRCALHSQGLEGRSQSAEACAQNSGGKKKHRQISCQAEKDKACGKEKKAGIHRSIGAVMVEEVPHKGTGYHDHQGKDKEEKAGAAAKSQASGVHGDKSKHPAVGKEHKASEDDGRERPFSMKSPK